MAYVDPSRRSKLPSIAAVALVHVAIAYAFLSGLAMRVIPFDDTIRLIPIAPEAPPPPPHPVPLPKPKVALPHPTTSPTPPEPTPQTTKPLGQSQVDTWLKSATTVDLPPLPPLPIPDGGAATQGKARAARARGDRGSWITSDDYPSASLRNGDEGAVGISVAIGVDGRVTACTVTASSGHPALDAATCRLYARRARFTSALDASGTPTTATVADTIRWQIPR